MSDNQVVVVAPTIADAVVTGPSFSYDVNGFVFPYVLDYRKGNYLANGVAVPANDAATFARSGSATMFDSTGTLVTIADGVPRLNSHLYNDAESFVANVSNGVDPDQQITVNFSNTQSGSTVSASGTVTGSTLTGTLVYTVHQVTDEGFTEVFTVASGTLNLDTNGAWAYSGLAWVNNGLQLESEARTNLVVQSEDFSNAAWSKQGVTIGAAVMSPDGSANAYPFVETTGTGEHNAFETVTGALTSGAPTTFSTFYKYVDRPFANLRTNLTGNYTSTFFNVQTGVIVSTGAGLTSAIEDCGSGWYRCSVTVLSASSTGDATVTVGMSADGTSESYTGDGTSSILIYGAQLEAGSTPSSYTPTAGSTVTRAAETLTASAANLPWPTLVETTGIELVTNNDFTNGTTGWSGSGATLSVVVAGRLRVTVVSSYGSARSSFATEIGKIYQYNFNRFNGTAGNNSIRIGTSNGGAQILNVFASNSEAPVSGFFVATATTTYLTLYAWSTTVGNYAEYNNISVKEINPLAVSLQISGKMNYSDGGGGNGDTIVPVYWYLNSTNRITSAISTITTRTGQVTFTQVASGTNDNVQGSQTSYAGGLNVPFNLASRHGSTFINGAIDGTLLTADTTPVSLPDLENTDLQIAQTFMGHVHLVRVVPDDLGNTGIGRSST
jgi:hypothetical protein